MAITITPVDNFPNFKSWIIEATADGDPAAVITHGFLDTSGAPIAPLKVWTEMIQDCQTAVGRWAVTLVGGVTLEVLKDNAVGSGIANPQVKVYAESPHTISR